jgi:L-alanine-DL-glutamate epimerase-like enolase superfamily enzyme
VKGGFAAKPEAPGLGVDLNEEIYKQRQGGRGGNTVPLDWI